MKSQWLIVLAFILTGMHAFAYDSNVYSMVVGDKALKLIETRQLTFKEDGDILNSVISPDGKWVAFISEFPDSTKLCLVKTTGGRPVVLLTGIGTKTETGGEAKAGTTEIWYFDSQDPRIDWSADSKCLAVSAGKVTWDAEKRTAQQYLLVYSTAGKNTILQQVDRQPRCFRLSPTGRRIAASNWSDRTDKDGCWLTVCDLQNHTSQTLPGAADISDIRGWADDGLSLLCLVSEDGRGVVKKKWLKGGDDEIVAKDYDLGISPDLASRVPLDGSGVVVCNVSTKAQATIVKSGAYRFASWAPTSKALALSEESSVADDAGKRSLRQYRLWLAAPEQRPLNTMLVAQDFDPYPEVTWSANACKLAYISQGRAYVAEFERRDLLAQEKLAVGMKLTEDDEKDILVANGKEIALGLVTYRDDCDCTFPASDSYEEDLTPYMKHSKLFARPGTDTDIFKYMVGGVKEGSIENPADTIAGELDAGYSWKVVIYADGHVKVVRK